MMQDDVRRLAFFLYRSAVSSTIHKLEYVQVGLRTVELTDKHAAVLHYGLAYRNRPFYQRYVRN